MTRHTQSSSIRKLKAKAWKVFERFYVVGIKKYIMSIPVFVATYLTSIVISFKNSFSPIFILQTSPNFNSFFSNSASPIWMSFALLPAFMAHLRFNPNGSFTERTRFSFREFLNSYTALPIPMFFFRTSRFSFSCIRYFLFSRVRVFSPKEWIVCSGKRSFLSFKFHDLIITS